MLPRKGYFLVCPLLVLLVLIEYPIHLIVPCTQILTDMPGAKWESWFRFIFVFLFGTKYLLKHRQQFLVPAILIGQRTNTLGKICFLTYRHSFAFLCFLLISFFVITVWCRCHISVLFKFPLSLCKGLIIHCDGKQRNWFKSEFTMLVFSLFATNMWPHAYFCIYWIYCSL